MPGLASLHDHAATQFVDLADGRRFACRRFGNATGVPLVLLHHFRATMDFWDPAITGGLAEGREVILIDNASIGRSIGETPSDVDTMADDIGLILDALGLPQIDVLGFSLGGMVAQPLAAARPDQVRKVILVGTGPRGGENMQLSLDVVAAATTPEPGAADEFLLFYSTSPGSRAAGTESLSRIFRRSDREQMTGEKAMKARARALMTWGEPPSTGRYAYLKEIRQPVLVINGHNDIMVPTTNSFLPQQHLPDAQLNISPDSGYASQFQYPEGFLADVIAFLDR